MDILIWGCGRYYSEKKCNFDNYNIMAFISSNPESDSYNGYPLIKPNQI